MAELAKIWLAEGFGVRRPEVGRRESQANGQANGVMCESERGEKAARRTRSPW